MTKHIIKSQTMKTLLIILLFATSLCYAQPAITNPTPLSVCDNDSDGLSVFNLTSKNNEILGSLLASNHTVSYHETFTDATIGVNSLGSNYSNINPFNQVVYVRVIENSDPANPSTAVLELVVNPLPIISPTPVSLTVCDAYILPALPSNQNYFTGPNGTGTILFAGDAITSTQTIYILAQSGTNPLCTAEESFVVTIIATPVTPNPSNVIACQAYTLPALPFGQSYHSVSGGNPATEIPAGTLITSTQTIYILAQSGTTPNCTSEASFVVTIGALPTFNTPSDLIQNDPDGTAVFDLQSQIPLITTDPNYVISFYETFTSAQAGANPISNGNVYMNISNPQTIWATINDPVTGCFSITNFDLIVNDNPFPITNPTPLQICDDNNDGFAVFDLSTKNFEILGALPAIDYTVQYYPTLIDSNNGTNEITGVTGYFNMAPFNQTVYVRVTELATSEFSTTTLQLIVNPLPTFVSPSNYTVNDSPYDGFALFDLTTKIPEISQGSNVIIEFYSSLLDAQNGTNPIANPSNYINSSNPQTIGVRVIDPATGCSSITSFDLIVNNSNPIPINNPTSLEVCDDNNDGFGVFNLDSKNSEILGSLSSSLYTVSYHENIFDAEMDGTGILSPYINTSPFIQTVAVRVEENANSSVFSTTFLTIRVRPIPLITTPIPNLTVYENPTDGVATFNLTLQSDYITNGNPSTNVAYYTSEADAYAQINQLPTPTAFTGTNTQIIWVNAQNIYGCFDVASFVLNVTDSANIIIFPDSNFKAKLLTSSPTNQVAYSGSGYVKIDANNDNEIQFTEAAVIDSLNVENANIIDVTGIAGFSNLKKFNCSNNQIVTLNLTSINTLLDLFCSNNSLTTLSVNGLSNLQNLYCSLNDLNTLDVSTNINLRNLDVKNNTIVALNTTNLTLLEYLDCSSNQLTNLNVSTNVNLKNFFCSFNALTSLNVSTLPLLEMLYLNHNQITNLQFGANTLLFELYCFNNNLTSLNTSNLIGLSYLDCSNNQISSLDVSQNSNLSQLRCLNNLLTTLDCSMNSSLNVLSLLNNPNLQTLFIKNGVNELNADSLLGCPNLTYICADDNQIPTIAASYPLITINSFCTFNPGGNFNTITGTAIIDSNNNGCNSSDSTMPYLGLNISLNGVSTNTSVYTNGLGIYNLFTTFPGIYQLAPNLENPTYFNISPIDIDSNTINDLTILQNICITPNGSYPDVEVVLAPIDAARPGFNASYELVYKNKGNQTLSGTLTLNYNDSVLDYVSATTAPTSQTTGIINWNYSNLQPFENRSIGLVLNVNSPVETPAVNIGDILTFTTTITPIVGDEIPADNTFVFNQTVVGSYDPNDITCLQGDTVSPSEIGNYLHYVINFENTGTYYAENVVVQDIIDTTQYDISSLQILNASHNMDARINGNKVEFVFQNINLAAVAGNPPVGGHGNVLFKIRSKSNLVTGDQVIKKASIFFDYNAPIITNDAETTYTSLNNGGFNPDVSLSVYPNPTSSILNISSDNTIESIELYDIQGRILEKSFQNSNAVILDISNRQSGVYFLKITSDKGSKVEKVVKK